MQDNKSLHAVVTIRPVMTSAALLNRNTQTDTAFDQLASWANMDYFEYY